MSPRTYEHKKEQIESWWVKEIEDINLTEKVIKHGQVRAIQSLKRTNQDMKLTQTFMNNPMDLNKLDSNIFIRSSISDEECVKSI